MSEWTRQAIETLRSIKLEAISREVLEMTAHVVGPSSAAAEALKDADSHNGPVRFWKRGNMIVVEKMRNHE